MPSTAILNDAESLTFATMNQVVNVLRLAQMVERATCDQLANKVEADMAAVLKHATEVQNHAEKQATPCVLA